MAQKLKYSLYFCNEKKFLNINWSLCGENCETSRLPDLKLLDFSDRSVTPFRASSRTQNPLKCVTAVKRRRTCFLQGISPKVAYLDINLL